MILKEDKLREQYEIGKITLKKYLEERYKIGYRTNELNPQ